MVGWFNFGHDDGQETVFVIGLGLTHIRAGWDLNGSAEFTKADFHLVIGSPLG